jgi:adenine-specific DNA methylase
LAACRAVVFASLIPDPDDPECPDEFRDLVMDILGKNQFRPTNDDGSFVKDTPRNRCLEFIKSLVRWENSNNLEYIEPAQKLIAAAHKFLHLDAEGDTPKVLDPFAGGGAIPLEALRLGCESHAIDLNPVAHLIELCTLVYPQKYGQIDCRPVPDYIKRLIAHNRAKRKAKGETDLFDTEEGNSSTDEEIIPDVEITEVEYQKNPLAADVKYWGYWLLAKARNELRHFYDGHDANHSPFAYIWARTVSCTNPTCRARVPLLRTLWLCKRENRRVAAQMVVDEDRKKVRFLIRRDREIDFDPSNATMSGGSARCPICQEVATAAYLRSEATVGRMGQQLVAVIETSVEHGRKHYRAAIDADALVFARASDVLEKIRNSDEASAIPTETIPMNEPRRVSPPLYGIKTFDSLYNDRQLLLLSFLCQQIRVVGGSVANVHESEYATAVASLLSCALARLADQTASIVEWIPQLEAVSHVFKRQAVAMVWDYVEGFPLGTGGGSFESALGWINAGLSNLTALPTCPAVCRQASATGLPYDDGFASAVITDPPYYDAVPYSDLSDFFYVWHKRTVGTLHNSGFQTPLTPKQAEIVEQRKHRLIKKRKDAAFYEQAMANALGEACRVLSFDGICCVMFAHKATSAWETLINALLRAGLSVTASWPLHTERPNRMRAIGTASLASSVTLVCRKRTVNVRVGFWDDVRQKLTQVAQERLDFFWNQGIRGADFFISAIGPSLSVFGEYKRVTKLSGEDVTVGQFLDEVRSLVTNYALAKILKTTHTAAIDPESRFYAALACCISQARTSVRCLLISG